MPWGFIDFTKPTAKNWAARTSRMRISTGSRPRFDQSTKDSDDLERLGARRFGSGVVGRIELHVLPDPRGNRPRPEDRGKLSRVLDGTMLGTKSENGSGLLGSDAGQLEKLGGVREIDSHFLRHGSLLERNAPTRDVKGQA